MSQGSVRTQLTLSRWFQLMGLHPLHANQVRIDGADQHCNHIYFKYPWQTADHVSRDEISEAIAESEAKIEAIIGYHLSPTWEVDEWKPTMRPFNQELVNLNSADIRGYRQIVPSDWGYFISGGIQAKSLIEAASSITWSDTNNDGLDDTATVTVATSVLDKNEIAVYYPGHDGDDDWEIRPIEVVISGGNAIITFRRELVIIEDKIETFDTEGAEAIYDDDADFLSTVDVYRKYNDPQTQASFLWEPLANACGACDGSGCPSCAYTTQTGCLIVRGDPRHSLIGYSPADWVEADLDFTPKEWSLGRNPDIVRLYYYSGWRDKKSKYISRLDKDWERPVAYMAAAMLDRPPCDCSKGDWSRWRQDLTLVAGSDDSSQAFFREPGSNVRTGSTLTGITDNPFGTRRGELYAWQHTSSLIRGTAVML